MEYNPYHSQQDPLQNLCDQLAECIKQSDSTTAHAIVGQLIDARAQIELVLPDDQPTTYKVPESRRVQQRPLTDPGVQQLMSTLQQQGVAANHAVDAARNCSTISECIEFLQRRYKYT